jgi:hypothetical protein
VISGVVAGRESVRLRFVLAFPLYRLSCALLRLLVRVGLDDRELEIVVLRHQLRVLTRGGIGRVTAPLTGPSSPRRAGSSQKSGGRPSKSSPTRSSAGAVSLTLEREGDRAGGRGVLRSISSCAS